MAMLCAAGAGLAGASHAAGAGVSECAAGGSALRSMVETEYAFVEDAQKSVRGAFLDYLANDALVLNPGPVPGRAVYEAAPPSKNQLEWYPTVAGIAASGDLGFTAGPWVFTAAAGGAPSFGHFLTVWRRDSSCRWRVELDGGVSHPVQPVAEARLVPSQLPGVVPGAPSVRLIAAQAPAHTIDEFAAVAQRDGAAAALRTFIRDERFILFTDGQAPLGAGAANVYLSEHPSSGRWQESAHGASSDSTLLYSVGEIMSAGQVPTHVYVQIWQYAPKAANWGLRALLISDLPPPKPSP